MNEETLPPVVPTAPTPDGALADARSSAATGFADGEWHRMHPATPLIRGSIGILAVVGVVLANMRNRIIGIFAPTEEDDDLLSVLIENDWLGWAALIGAGLLLLCLLAFWLSWRAHSVRITDEVVEVRSGLLVRSHRQARLDRIQGIAVVRPWLARLLAVSRLDVEAAGISANVQLAYLRKAEAEALRRDLIRLASGLRRAATEEDAVVAAPSADGDAAVPVTSAGALAAGARSGSGADLAADEAMLGVKGSTQPAENGTAAASPVPGLLRDRLHEFTDLSEQYQDVPDESLVRVPAGRVIGSLALSGVTVLAVLGVIAFLLVYWITEQIFGIYIAVPAAIGIAGFVFTKLSNGLNYHLAQNPDGVRIGSGLISQRSDTVPPGRVHALQLRQPLLWRLTDWWQVRVTRANLALQVSAQDQARSELLPVGTRADVEKVLTLLMPTLRDEHGMLSPRITDSLTGSGPGFVTPPPRVRFWRPWSWRRMGAALDGEFALLRTGPFARSLVIIPLARAQGVAVTQGRFGRWLGLASIRITTVPGAVPTRVRALPVREAEELFRRITHGAVQSAARDRSHRWAQEQGGTDGT